MMLVIYVFVATGIGNISIYARANVFHLYVYYPIDDCYRYLVFLFSL